VCAPVLKACAERGLSAHFSQRFFTRPAEHWRRYFGPTAGRPHFTVNSLEYVEAAFGRFDDVLLWIYTNAKPLVDPGGQFARAIEAFAGYPEAVLVKKLKYRWLLAAYWAIDVYPGRHRREEDALPAATAVCNGINEYLRVFYLAEGKPFPYTERLATCAGTTELGRRFGAFLLETLALVVGARGEGMDLWERLDAACERILMTNECPGYAAMERACQEAMLARGVEPGWIEADYDNIDELLMGRLGPVP
jgi:hypothetical protein